MYYEPNICYWIIVFLPFLLCKCYNKWGRKKHIRNNRHRPRQPVGWKSSREFFLANCEIYAWLSPVGKPFLNRQQQFALAHIPDCLKASFSSLVKIKMQNTVHHNHSGLPKTGPSQLHGTRRCPNGHRGILRLTYDQRGNEKGNGASASLT